MKKTFKVIMLMTEKEGAILKFHASEKLMASQGKMVSNVPFKSYDLYILSKDEIKVGDWFLMNGCLLRQCRQVNSHLTASIEDTTGGQHYKDACEKIISTTESISGATFVPSIPKSFINECVESYNNGNPITEVDLEFEPKIQRLATGEEVIGSESEYNLKVKTNDDGSVITHKSKLYTKEEVIELTLSAMESMACSQNSIDETHSEFIKEHIK